MSKINYIKKDSELNEEEIKDMLEINQFGEKLETSVFGGAIDLDSTHK